jgi:pimeloyl-ACP methyl ester carboxylesterase
MAYFDSDGVQIYYEEHGGGEPVILVHGFASRADHNWGEAWFTALGAHYRVIALDCRGHGKSGKPHDARAYAGDTMGDDVIRLMDHLGVARTLLMGYSMGGRISLGLLRSHPERLRAVVLGGIGAASASDGSALMRNRKPIVEALLADDASTIAAETPRQFRQFAAAVGNDLKALAACMGADRADLTAEEIAARPIKVPVLIVIGTKDLLVGDPSRLNRAIPGSQLVMLEGRDHLSAPGDDRFKEEVLRFLRSAPA